MPAGSIRLLSRVAEHQLAPDEHAHDAAPRARASHPQTRRGAGCGATAPALARRMAGAAMGVAAVLLTGAGVRPSLWHRDTTARTAHEQRAGHQQQLKVRTRADEQQHRHAYAVCATWFMSDHLSVNTQAKAKEKRASHSSATATADRNHHWLESYPLPPVALPVVCGLWSIAKHLFPIFCESAMRGVYFLVRQRAEGVC